MGGITCDTCKILVVAGTIEHGLHWIYGDQPFYTGQVLEYQREDFIGKEVHFCSSECIEVFEKKFNAKVQIICITSPLGIEDE